MSNDIFGPGSNFKKRFIPDYDELVQRIEACRKLGMTIVLTSGAFDIKHIGHDRYVERGKELANGGLLVVGVDSDEKIRAKKGPSRPIVPEAERLEGLCHLRHVDLVTLKPANRPQWELIGMVKPDILLITEETYDTPDSLAKLEAFCAQFDGTVHRLPPQATTSTTAKIRMLMFEMKHRVKDKLAEVIVWIDEL